MVEDHQFGGETAVDRGFGDADGEVGGAARDGCVDVAAQIDGRRSAGSFPVRAWRRPRKVGWTTMHMGGSDGRSGGSTSVRRWLRQPHRQPAAVQQPRAGRKQNNPHLPAKAGCGFCGQRQGRRSSLYLKGTKRRVQGPLVFSIWRVTGPVDAYVVTPDVSPMALMNEEPFVPSRLTGFTII